MALAGAGHLSVVFQLVGGHLWQAPAGATDPLIKLTCATATAPISGRIGRALVTGVALAW